MNFFNAALDKPYRHRYPLYIINFAVALHIFMSSKDAQAFLYSMFRVNVSHKTICQWSKKFLEFSPKEKIIYDKDETVLLFADEKFVKIKNKRAYWWSVRDHRGNLLASIITIEHDIQSATKLFLMARERIDGKVHAVVRDALASYNKAIA